MNPLKESAIMPTQSHLVGIYFVLTCLVSWTGAFLVAFPYLFQHRLVSKNTGLVMFQVMLLGPSLIGLALIWML